MTGNVIIVTINYRLGALGFLWDDSIGISGNYGFLDQLMAIKWVYKNIANFGGDVNKMIIYGESAGGDSVLFHLISNNNITHISDYIKGGIAESTLPGIPMRTPENWSNLPAIFSDIIGCSTEKLSNSQRLACMKSVDANTIVSKQSSANLISPQLQYLNIKIGLPWQPTIGSKDGLFTTQPVFGMQNGSFNKDLSFMAGTNKDESWLFYPTSKHENPVQFVTQWSATIGEDATQKMIEYYNISLTPLTQDLVNDTMNIQTDVLFRCPLRNVMNSHAKYALKQNSTYFYHLNYVSPFNSVIYKENPLCWEHVCHTNELWYVFNDDLKDTFDNEIDWSDSQSDKLLRDQIIGFWTNFGQTGNPNQGDNVGYLNGVKWDTFDLMNRNTMSLDSGKNMTTQINPDKDPCDFWDEIGYTWLNGI